MHGHHENVRIWIYYMKLHRMEWKIFMYLIIFAFSKQQIQQRHKEHTSAIYFQLTRGKLSWGIQSFRLGYQISTTYCSIILKSLSFMDLCFQNISQYIKTYRSFTHLQFTACFSDILAVRAVWVPVQLPVPKVFGFVSLSVEARGKRSQNDLHHG